MPRLKIVYRKYTIKDFTQTILFWISGGLLGIFNWLSLLPIHTFYWIAGDPELATLAVKGGFKLFKISAE